MYRNLPRVTRFVGAAGALALVIIPLSPLPTQAVDARSGTCALELEATVSGDTITFAEIAPGGALTNTCVLETGAVATGYISGSFSALALSFECYEAVGTGSATFGYTRTDGPGNEWADLPMAAVKLGDSITITLSHIGLDFVFTGVGEFVQADPSAQVCLSGENPVRWVGSFTWQDPVFEEG